MATGSTCKSITRCRAGSIVIKSMAARGRWGSGATLKFRWCRRASSPRTPAGLKRRGVDPLLQRQTEAQAERVASITKTPSLRPAPGRTSPDSSPKWRNPKSEAQWTQSLRDYVYPVLGDLPVDVIDKGLVIKALDTVWTTHPVTGERIRARIQKILDYAATMDYRSGDNPAVWTGKLEHVLTHPGELHTPGILGPALDRDRRLRGEAAGVCRVPQIRRGRGERGRARTLNPDQLTDQRSAGRAQGGGKPPNRTWTRPASRMKSYKKPHNVPLSVSAMAIVEPSMALHPESPFIFPRRNPHRPLAPATFRRLMERLGYGDFDVHGFRACLGTWVEDCTNLDRIAAEIALAHRVGTVVEETYARGEMFAKRQVFADAWDAYCNGETGEVVTFPSVDGGACR